MEKDARALTLHARGATYANIAKTPGQDGKPMYGTPQAAFYAVQRAIKDIAHLNTEEALTEAEERLRLLQLTVLREMEGHDHYVISNGRFMLDPQGNPVRDSGFYLNCVTTLLRLEESRRKLRGLDQPAKLEVRTVDQFDAQLAELAERLGISKPGSQSPLPAGSPDSSS